MAIRPSKQGRPKPRAIIMCSICPAGWLKRRARPRTKAAKSTVKAIPTARFRAAVRVARRLLVAACPNDNFSGNSRAALSAGAFASEIMSPRIVVACGYIRCQTASRSTLLQGRASNRSVISVQRKRDHRDGVAGAPVQRVRSILSSATHSSSTRGFRRNGLPARL